MALRAKLYRRIPPQISFVSLLFAGIRTNYGSFGGANVTKFTIEDPTDI